MKTAYILRSVCSTIMPAYLLMLMTSSAIAANQSIVPQAAFFGGLGGGWSSVSFDSQNVYGKGTSYSPPYGMHTAQIGSAAGSTSLQLNSESALAPIVQVGYFQHMFNGPWMSGGKISYSYINIGSAKNDLQIPQAGGFTEDGSFTPFTGNYLVQSYRQNVNQQISLIPFIGRSFERSYIYLGAGPTFVQTKTYIEDITGYENVTVIPTTPTGVGLGETYTTTQWLCGGIVMIGATYFIDPTWLIDISYTYTITGTKTSSWGGSWRDIDINRGNVTRTGTNSGTSSGNVNTQAFTISINKVF